MGNLDIGKQPRRPHFIEEWAEQYGDGLSQADLARALDVDKSVVSRWYNGTTPGIAHQKRLAALFGCDREALFRHPDEAWFSDFFAGRSKDEVARGKQMLVLAFPKRADS